MGLLPVSLPLLSLIRFSGTTGLIFIAKPEILTVLLGSIGAFSRVCPLGFHT